MRVTYKFLKDYIDIPVSPFELKDIFNELGMEVEDFIDIRKGKKDLLIAEIEDISSHPNSDFLKVLTLVTKKGKVQVVSGAPFIDRGKKVIYAPPGTELEKYKVEVKKIRGIESYGTIISEEELGLEDKSDTVIFLDEKIPLEENPLEVLGIDDYVYDLAITPNRPDLLGVIGIARELSAYFGTNYKIPDIKSLNEEVIDFNIEIDKDVPCDRYVGIIIKDIEVKRTPNKIRYFLNLCGIRSINCVVDATNFVMLETGQPLHAFDLSKIKKKIIVRFARNGERILCLDGIERELSDDIMVIADSEKPVAIAGIIGGENEGVTEQTKEVLCESAFFDAISIRKSSTKLNVRTESSYRFERKADFNMVEYAAFRLRDLIIEFAGGTPFKPIDVRKRTYKKPQILLRESKIKKILGGGFNKENSGSLLKRLGFEVKEKTDGVIVEVPSFRRDIEIEEDLVEEIARLYGYDKIPSEPEKIKGFIGKRDDLTEYVRAYWVGAGFLECFSLSIVDDREKKLFREDYVEIENPFSKKFSVLRNSLLISLINSYLHNKRKGNPMRKMFEIGKVFWGEHKEEERLGAIISNIKFENWIEEQKISPYFELKGILESFLKSFGKSVIFKRESRNFSDVCASIYLDKENIGIIGVLSNDIKKFYDFEEDIAFIELNFGILKKKIKGQKFTPFSPYPVLSRDLSFLGPENVDAYIILDAFEKLKEVTFLESYILIDVYKGKPLPEGIKNFTFRVFFRSPDRTLSEREIDKEVEKIIKYIEDKTTFRFRR